MSIRLNTARTRIATFGYSRTVYDTLIVRATNTDLVPEVGAAMSSHPGIDMISFTGSTRAGWWASCSWSAASSPA